MSEARDLDRDLRLADELGRLPAPALPVGLAARIVQNATRLPQHAADAPVAIEPVPIEPVVVEVASAPQRRRRWLPPAIGTAVAASLLAALFMHRSESEPARPATPVQVAQNAAVPLPAPAVDTPAVAQAGPARLPAGPKTTAGAGGARTKRAAEPVGPAQASPSPSPEAQPDPSADRPEAQTPVLASNPPTAGPASKPTGRAFVGPPDTDDLGATLPQSSPASGFGISGTGVPDHSTPPPPGRGGRTGGMPRF